MKKPLLQLIDIKIEKETTHHTVTFIFKVNRRIKDIFCGPDFSDIDAEATRLTDEMVDMPYYNMGCCGWTDCNCRTIEKVIFL